MTLADVERDFGADVAAIVDGVTKLDRLAFDTKEEQQAATVRKMIVAMSKDLRVLIIKLADRLHNMRTIGGMPTFKQERTARETLDIFAPLAHRLGMQDMRQQLEDLSFAALHPKRFAEIDHMVSTRTPERELYLHQVIDQVNDRLAELRLSADVTGRPKHLWSIYEKMVVKGREFNDIFDLVAIRVIVDSVKDCYAAVGSIHATWKPVPGRFKDYIAMPKFNLYQSLHTTVVGPQGKPLEVQIRTTEMHARAERGVAAHWQYKATQKERETGEDYAWLSRIVDWQEETSDPDEFMKNLKVDLEQDEVFVFSPKGRVITLPVRGDADRLRLRRAHRGRPRLHRRQGQRTPGAARQPGRRRATPSRSSPRRSRVPARRATGSTSWSARGPATRSASGSRASGARTPSSRVARTWSRRLRRENLPIKSDAVTTVLEEIAASMNYADIDALHAAIGEHHVSAKSVAGRVAKALQSPDADREEQMPTSAVHDRRSTSRTQAGQRRRARRGPRRRHGPALPLLHARSRRRDRRLHHPGPWRLGAPLRLRQRGLAGQRPGRPAHRRRVGRRPGRLLRGLHRDQGARPGPAAPRRHRSTVRPPREHHRLVHPGRPRPGVDHALRLRAGRSVPPRLGAVHDQDHRLGLRRLPRRPRQGRLDVQGSNALTIDDSWSRPRYRRPLELHDVQGAVGHPLDPTHPIAPMSSPLRPVLRGILVAARGRLDRQPSPCRPAPQDPAPLPENPYERLAEVRRRQAEAALKIDLLERLGGRGPATPGTGRGLGRGPGAGGRPRPRPRWSTATLAAEAARTR